MKNFLEEIWRVKFSERMAGGGRTRSHYHWIKIQIFWKKLSWDNWTLHLSSSSIIGEVSQYKKRSVQFLISKSSSKYFLLWFKMFFITFTEYWTWALQSSIFHQPFMGSDSSFTTETFLRLGKTWWISSIVFSSSATISSTLKSLPKNHSCQKHTFIVIIIIISTISPPLPDYHTLLNLYLTTRSSIMGQTWTLNM